MWTKGINTRMMYEDFYGLRGIYAGHVHPLVDKCV